MFFGALLKVHADLRQNNKAIVLHFKMLDFVKFRQISSKINILCCFLSFRQKKKFSVGCLRGVMSLYLFDSCEVCLGEFLQNIMRRSQKVDFHAMANILVVHSQSSGNYYCISVLYTLVHKMYKIWSVDSQENY